MRATPIHNDVREVLHASGFITWYESIYVCLEDRLRLWNVPEFAYTTAWWRRSILFSYTNSIFGYSHEWLHSTYLTLSHYSNVEGRDSITSQGFKFALLDQRTQLWSYLLNFFRLFKVRNLGIIKYAKAFYPHRRSFFLPSFLSFFWIVCFRAILPKAWPSSSSWLCPTQAKCASLICLQFS